MTEREKSYAGMLYQPGDPELSADRDETIRKLQEYNNMDPWIGKQGRRQSKEYSGKPAATVR